MMGLGALAAADKFDHMDDKEVNHDQDNDNNDNNNNNKTMTIPNSTWTTRR